MDLSFQRRYLGEMTARGTALLDRAIDYAGLFPPAARSMHDAIAECLAAKSGPDASMLGRFVIPATRLSEFSGALATAPVDAAGWRLSAIVRDRSAEDVAAIQQFNSAAPRHMIVDSIEAKPASIADIQWLADTFRGRFEIFVEAPAGADANAWIEQIVKCGLRAKVRTGGLTADAFPTPQALLMFIDAAVRHRAPFKATAGLHHATRGSYALTYEAGSPQAVMFGYLNVLLATAALHQGLPRHVALDLLDRRDAKSLVITSAGADGREEEVRWGGVTVSHASIAAARQQLLLSFGSCSFTEPATEYRRIHDGSLSTRR